MPGVKTIANQTEAPMTMTLYVRAGDNPSNYAPSTSFNLNPGEVKTVQYGNATDVYVNGYVMVTAFSGQLLTKQEVVAVRGCPLDNTWNTNSKFEIKFQGGDFLISAHN